jgi:ATPase family associated with various cellular activities (AAA)
MSLRDTLLAANIVHLSPAARAAGLQFRNGTLSKTEIVDALIAGGYAQRALEVLGQLQGGQPLPSMPQTPTQAPAPAPVPLSPPQATQAPDALVNALRAAIGAVPIDPETVRGIAQEVADNSLKAFSGSQESRIALAIRDAVSKIPQGTTIHLPNLPEPVTLPGIQHNRFPRLLTRLHLGLNVMLVGPASSGKTYSAEQAAKALGKKFYLMGAVNYEHSILGYQDAQGRYVRTAFRDAFEHGGLILMDEFDASSAEAPLAINAALANGQAHFPDGMVTKHPDFLCIIGANTDGSGATMQYPGRARLDGAFCDRFVIIRWDIDANIERSKAGQFSDWLACVREVRGFMLTAKIQDVAATMRAVDYGARLLSAKVPREEVLEDCLCRGALVSQWNAVRNLPAVREFLAGF